MKNEVKNYARSLAELAATSMLSEIAIPPRSHAQKKIPDISLVFKFDTGRIDEYLQKVENEINNEPWPKLPDIRDHLKKQKEEK